MTERLPHLLAVILGIVIIWSGIAPFSRDVWLAEIIPVLLVFGGLVWLYPHFRFSNAAYLIMAIAAAYEIIEWLYADLYGGQAGIEFLGSQGDIWDAQKDMLSDTLGAVFALLLFAAIRPDRQHT